MTKVTQWFKCDMHKPVHVGQYEIKYMKMIATRYWDGTCWRITSSEGKTMFNEPGNGYQWRGLARKKNT